MKHLSPEEFLAYREGRLEALDRQEHLATCRKCRSRIEGLRWQETLLGKAKGTAVEEHPGRDEISGYLHEALFPGEVERLKRHFQACDRCMALYSRMRRESAVGPLPLPSAGLLRKVKQRFRRPAGTRSLGMLVLEMVKGMSLRFLPLPDEPLPAAGPVFRDYFPSGTMKSRKSYRETRKESSQHALRIDDLEGSTSDFTAPEPPAKESSAGREEMLSRELEVAGPTPPSPPVGLEAGRWRLSIAAAGSVLEPRLEITVRDREEERPVPGVLFEMIRAETVASRARSDDRGRLSLEVPRGDCRLQVGEETTFTLRLLTIG